MEDIFINYLTTKYYIYSQFGGAEKKWNTFSHNGILFPPEYTPHKIPILYHEKEIILPPPAEEAITLYAKFIDTEYVKNKRFNKNFWNDFKHLLPPNTEIKSLEEINLSKIYNHLLKQKEIKDNKPKEQKLQEKLEREKSEEKYKYALVDGKKQPVGNYKIEPPGIFLGRGNHPKIGMIKSRIYPEDVTINIGKNEKIPSPLPGHTWKKVIHDDTAEWIASWKDDINNKVKYVWLSASSSIRGKEDMEKFDLARKLKSKISKIRKANEENLKSNDLNLKQIATALYFVDNFALRVGNEKTAEQADTVGVTSLRVEHITLLENNNIKLDFLSKDSVRYNRILTVDEQVYKNLQLFITGKDKKEDLFDLINSNSLNKYLQSFMENLTAKVYRTYNSSDLFSKELKKVEKKIESQTFQSPTAKLNLILDEFNKANAKVAKLCNHQKNITKSSASQIESINIKIKNLKQKIKNSKNPETKLKYKEKLSSLKSKKELKQDIKNISLSTSKVNYIDPRITVAFMKKYNLPIDKIFSKTLQEKFKWSLEVGPDFEF